MKDYGYFLVKGDLERFIRQMSLANKALRGCPRYLAIIY